MKHVTLFLFLVFPGYLFAQSFAPEVTLKSGIHRISDHSFNPDYEQQHSVMYEIAVSHPVFTFENSMLSLGLSGTVRREADALKTYYCSDCPQFDFKGQSFGPVIKLQSVNTHAEVGIYSGLNLNRISIDQTRFGMLPAHIQPEPLISIRESYLDFATGLKVDIPVYKFFYLSSDFRLYFPLDDSDFNQRRTALSAGLSLKF